MEFREITELNAATHVRVLVGGVAYDIRTAREGARWRASAIRAHDGEPFGAPLEAALEAEAVERISVWLNWQHAHGEALATLQEAERVYHRSIADGAFAGDAPGATVTHDRRSLLAAIEQARAHLDVIRARRPA